MNLGHLFKNVKNYWYLDDDGIKGLYSQSVDFIEQGRTVTEGSARERKSSLKLAVKALAAIFGSAEIKTDINQKISDEFQISKQLNLETEQILKKIIAYLNESNQLNIFTELDELFATREDQLPLFCIGSIPLQLDTNYYDEIYTKKTKGFLHHSQINVIDLIAKQKFVLFSATNDDDQECNKVWNRVLLGGSLDKWPTLYVNEDGDLGSKLGHLLILFREADSSPINLKFLGHLSKSGNSLYIKPYAIWDIAGLINNMPTKRLT